MLAQDEGKLAEKAVNSSLFTASTRSNYFFVESEDTVPFALCPFEGRGRSVFLVRQQPSPQGAHHVANMHLSEPYPRGRLSYCSPRSQPLWRHLKESGDLFRRQVLAIWQLIERCKQRVVGYFERRGCGRHLVGLTYVCDGPCGQKLQLRIAK